MDIIHKIIPKNPVNSATQDKIKKTVQEVLQTFLKNYANYTKLEIVKNKEQEYSLKQKREEYVKKDSDYKTKYYKKKFGPEAEVPKIPEPLEKGASLQDMTKYCIEILELGFKPLRPRGKYEPLKPPTLVTNLVKYEIRDADFDPYAIYILKSRKGNLVAEKERRFKEFKELNKKLKKELPKNIVLPNLPEASSKIGVRNLTEGFLEERVKLLGEYLTKIAEIPEIQENEDFLFFIGLLPSKNPMDDQIFNAALRRTKYDLWNWYSIIYDKPEVGISKLISIEVWRTVRVDVEAALPNAEALRKTSKKLAIKIINGAVDAAVPPAWKTAYEASGPARQKVQEVLGSVIEIIVTKKHEINEQLKNKIFEFFTPIKEALAKILTIAASKVLPPILKPFSKLVKMYTDISEPLIKESFNNCDKNKLREGVDKLNKIHRDLVEELNKECEKCLKEICVELQGLVTLRLLVDCFNPMNALGVIIRDFVKMIEPDHWSKIVEVLFEFKAKLKQNKGDADNILTDMERNAYYYIRDEYWRMDYYRWYLRYDIIHLGLNLDSVAQALYKVGEIVQKQLYKKSAKKLVRKFADYVWGFSQEKINEKPWADRVDEAFSIAYDCAKKKFNKECGKVIKDAICECMGSMVLNKIIEEIKEKLKPVIESLNGIIPENIKDMVDLQEMVNEDIEEILTKTFEDAVNDQDEVFVKELNNACDECVLDN